MIRVAVPSVLVYGFAVARAFLSSQNKEIKKHSKNIALKKSPNMCLRLLSNLTTRGWTTQRTMISSKSVFIAEQGSGKCQYHSVWDARTVLFSPFHAGIHLKKIHFSTVFTSFKRTGKGGTSGLQTYNIMLSAS